MKAAIYRGVQDLKVEEVPEPEAGANEVKLCIGIAAKGDEHGELLGNLAEKLLEPSSYKALMESASTTELLELINL